MFVLGVTGSIGMGKSWGGQCFRRLGVPVHDADECVHHLMAPGGAAVAAITATFGDVRGAQGGIDRLKLGEKVLGDAIGLSRLETILHPAVREAQRRFLRQCCLRGERLVVLDIPLLFETGGRTKVDAVAVMSAPAFVQAQRVLRRRGMSREKLDAILHRQMDDGLKRRLADYIIATGATRGDSYRQIAAVAKDCRRQDGQVWGPHWGHMFEFERH